MEACAKSRRRHLSRHPRRRAAPDEILKRHGARGDIPVQPGRTIPARGQACVPARIHEEGLAHVRRYAYGLKTLLSEHCFLAPTSASPAGDICAGRRDEGFETGIHSWDHVKCRTA